MASSLNRFLILGNFPSLAKLFLFNNFGPCFIDTIEAALRLYLGFAVSVDLHELYSESFKSMLDNYLTSTSIICIFYFNFFIF